MRVLFLVFSALLAAQAGAKAAYRPAGNQGGAVGGKRANNGAKRE